MNKIPFSKLTFDEKEEQAVIDCMRSGWIVLGPKTAEFEQKFAEYVGAKYAVFVDSGTSALTLSLYAMADYYPNSVSIPSLTFVSDAEVVHNAGLEINFVDVNKETLCVDMDWPNLLPVNFAGVKAKGYGKVIDSCHRIEKDDVKDSDSLWCYSFYATKNITCGHGGMIALNDKDVYEWLLMARDHGMDKGTKQRYEGKTPVYDVKFPAWRVKGNDLMAVIGLEQLKKLPWITLDRNRVVALYNKKLGLNRVGNHLYWIFVNERDLFIKQMFEAGIQTSIHFLPIHRFTGYNQYHNSGLPVTEFAGEHIVSLPLFPRMTNEEVDYVCEKVLETNLMIK